MKFNAKIKDTISLQISSKPINSCQWSCKLITVYFYTKFQEFTDCSHRTVTCKQHWTLTKSLLPYITTVCLQKTYACTLIFLIACKNSVLTILTNSKPLGTVEVFFFQNTIIPVPFNPLTTMIWLLILPSSCYTFPGKLVTRTWC